MYLEGDVRGLRGEDAGPHLLEAAEQRRTSIWIGPCSVSYEMLQSQQAATQVTTTIFQSVVEALVLLQWARAPFTLSWKSWLVRDRGEDSSPDWLRPWARSGIEAPCLPWLWKYTGSTRFMPGALCLRRGQMVASRLVIWMRCKSSTCSRMSTRPKEEAGGQLSSIIAHMLRNCVQMEHALIAVKMVLVAWFTFNSFRKQVLAFSVMGQKHKGGFWCAFWCAPTVEHGIIWGFCLSKKERRKWKECLQSWRGKYNFWLFVLMAVLT